MTQERQLLGDGGVPIPPPSLDDVLLDRRDGYAIVTLNRPVVLNAVNWSILRRLKWALDECDADNGVKAIILTGAGRAFCAGGDLQSRPPEDGLTTPPAMDIYMKIWSMPKPVIAAVRGYAVGQGVELAGVCDMTVAGESAQFGEIQIRHGFGPPVLITPYTTAGHKQAKELLLLGEQYDAREAQRLGLVNRVVADDDVMAEAERMAQKIASLSQRTVRQNKVLVNRAYELAGFREALAYRNDPMVQALAQQTPGDDQSEHIRTLRERGWEAFRESRDKLYQAE
jgi:enoyl-CoA hydratase/carnithine racemase